MSLANEKRRYNVTSSLIGWAHNQNVPGDAYSHQAQYVKTYLQRWIAQPFIIKMSSNECQQETDIEKCGIAWHDCINKRALYGADEASVGFMNPFIQKSSMGCHRFWMMFVLWAWDGFIATSFILSRILKSQLRKRLYKLAFSNKNKLWSTISTHFRP